jgi:Ca2+-binding RTX toxin-like protein
MQRALVFGWTGSETANDLLARVHDGPYAADAIPANTSTTEVIGAPGSRTSAIDTIGDQDWFRVTLNAGVTYSFALTGTGGGSLSNPYLSLYNSSGALIALDDDSGAGYNAWIASFTPSTSGTYYLGAMGVAGSTGTYTLEAFVLSGPDTIAGDASTTSSLVINGASASSAIETAGDQDWFRVTLTAGESYAFSLTGTGGTPLSDSYLEIRDASGNLVSLDDDGGAGLNSLMRFTATQSGTYYLVAKGYDTATGGYTISAANGPPQNPLDTLDLGFTFDTNAISVYFAASGEQLGPLGTAVRSWTASEQSAAMAALGEIAHSVNLTFSVAASAATADFIFALTNLPSGVLGETYPGASIAYLEFDPNEVGWTTAGLTPGGLGYSVIIHEAGHALGLDHPFYDGGDNQVMQGVIDSFDSYGAFLLNQQVFTIMSYNDGWPLGPYGVSSSYNYGYASTPMALDIAALQQRYGANASFHAGSDTYALPTTNAGAGYQAIWDTGGIDTISYSGDASATINLNDATLLSEVGGGGFVSYAAGIYGGFTIAAGVVIENAIGGSGNDAIIGNEANNTLTGGAGADALDGGAGTDAANYAGSSAGVSVSLLTGTGAGGDAAGDTLVNIENLTGSAYADALTGDGLANTLAGNDGADTLDGGVGADLLQGGNGDDVFIGGAGADVLGGGAGTDTADYSASLAGVTVNLATGLGAGGDAQGDSLVSIESVIGSAYADVLAGKDGVADVLNGGDGDDRIVSSIGADTLIGGNGTDTLDYSNSFNGVDIRLFQNSAAGGAANGDIISGFENIIGSVKTDTLAGDDGVNWIWGGAGNETITGRDGADHLFGEAGNDTLLGGAGDDVLVGAAGADTYGGGVGADTVDFSASAAGVTVNLATGAGTGGDAQGDVFVSIENVIGSAFADVIVGKANVWNNVFDGRGGDDTLTGGLGDDAFVFRLGEGSDAITDFSPLAASNNDVIELVGFGAAFDSFAEVMAAASQNGADVVIDFGSGQTLTLQNLTLAALASADFIFG